MCKARHGFVFHDVPLMDETKALQLPHPLCCWSLLAAVLTGG